MWPFSTIGNVFQGFHPFGWWQRPAPPRPAPPMRPLPPQAPAYAETWTGPAEVYEQAPGYFEDPHRFEEPRRFERRPHRREREPHSGGNPLLMGLLSGEIGHEGSDLGQNALLKKS